MYTSASINVLLTLIREGDWDALSELILRKVDFIQNVAAKTIYQSFRPNNVAESQAQRLTVALMTELRKSPVDTEEHFDRLTWRIAQNLMVDRYRSRHPSESLDAENGPIAIADLEASPIRPLLMQEVLEQIDKLSPRQEAIVRLWLKAWTHSRIAKHLKVSTDVVDSEIKKAREHLGFDDIRICKKREPRKLDSQSASFLAANVGFISASNMIAAANDDAEEGSAALEGQGQLLTDPCAISATL